MFGWTRKNYTRGRIGTWRSKRRWLGDAFKDKLPAGLVLRLPTEAEWEKAARGNDGRIYPWGDAFDQTKRNTVDGGNGVTTPLGAYSPQGDSPYGCADMSGNVWEWTHSIYKPYPYQVNDGREDKNSMNICVLYGGSYANYGTNARCAERDASQFPDPFNTRIIVSQPHWGFRVAVLPTFLEEI